ncbi:DNL zinc finger domain-containing protein [Tricharina praecox]|uniref:DNL zinc finger domain-containing protein n=1 Tax=Tricharina praecox TaxID=43433 RepID=UPI00221F873A|nr:DNL zinc finger domain-containing protein [Tricharina praecox]KAI5846976.1 DNL zinc finger domain-containing protein [Tricharina praecox]
MSLRLVLPRALRRTLLASAGRPLIAPIPPAPRILASLPRWNSTASTAATTPTPSPSPTSTETSTETETETETPKEAPPSYQLTFTCRPCRTRSTHAVSKQAYHRGSVLVQCPGCKNRHVITDHLKIFGEQQRTLEDILKEAGNGEVLKRARMLDNGDIELLPPDEAVAEGEEGGQKMIV